ETCIHPDRAEAILKLPGGTLRDELRQLLDSYPEHDLARKIKHFKIFERGRRCYFEGEDRTRSFLWQDSPFYSPALFRHSMGLPDRHKQYNVFCRQALIALSPEAAGSPVTPRGQVPKSWKYVLFYRVKETVQALPAPLVKLARRVIGIVPEGHYVVPQPRAAY